MYILYCVQCSAAYLCGFYLHFPDPTQGFTFVKFYAPWCGHCQAMEVDWELLGDHYSEHPLPATDLTLAAVDCVKSARTCVDQGVSGYPAIKLYKDGVMQEDYMFARSTNRMKRFLADKLVDIDLLQTDSIGKYTLNDDLFEKFIQRNVLVVLKFFIPGCHHCKTFESVYDELSKYFKLLTLIHIYI